MQTLHRVAASVGALAVAAVVVACAPAAPASVVPGSRVVVGWGSTLTSLNALDDPTPGNLDIAAATRGRFGTVVDGTVVPDESFGAVRIVQDDPFTVRYDLAEPAWSDGTPVDAADLMLGWAWAAGELGPEDAAGSASAAPVLVDPERPPVVDEFARAIDVTFAEPTSEWQSAITADVPAHVLGRVAFGLDDPMEAKQAVIRAVQDDDPTALGALAAAWRGAFAVDDSGAAEPGALLSSGPYRVDAIDAGAAGQSVVLVPNAAYRGAATPQIARVELVPAGDAPLGAIGDRLDVVRVAPSAENRAPLRALERRDVSVDTTDDGTVWSVLVRGSGIFSDRAARAALLRAIPVRDLIDRGAGEWAPAYATTTSMLTAPESPAAAVVAEDSGFALTLGTPAEDPALDRQLAGIPAGTRACVLYDRASAFAAGAYAALRDALAPEGWVLVDCGADDLATARAQGGWDVLIDRVPVPGPPAQITALWGPEGEMSALLAAADPARDELVAELSRTVDVYRQRELRAQIEATVVRAAVARPIAMNPVATVVVPRVGGVAARAGVPLAAGLAQWTVTP